MHLLDINLLIAVVDPFHVHHTAALDWFTQRRHEGWATCPVTENGFIRILSNPKYPGGLESAGAARMLLLSLCSQPGHQFWPDSFSLTDLNRYPSLPVSKHLTDFYLLALAIRHRADFVTFDKRIDPGLLSGGPQAMLCLGT
jgi:hypothetical protein